MRRAAALLLLLLPPPASAEPGLVAAPFLLRALGAAPAAMGGAFVAVRDRIDSMQYNPAALATLSRKSLTSTYLNGLGGTTYGFLGYGHPFRYGTLAAGALYYNAGTIDLNLSNGATGRVAAEEDSAWTASYAARILPGLSIGGTYRYVRLSLAQTARAATSQGDIGALWMTPLKGLSLGAACQYIGPAIRFEDAGDPAPRTIRYGLAYRFPDLNPAGMDPSIDLQSFDMTLAADIVRTLHEKQSPRVGAEFGLKPAMMTRAAVRLGWVFERDAESFTFGLGLEQGRFGLDYAFGLAKDLGNLQEVTLLVRF